MAAEGVPLHQLRCPTCGALYENFNLHSDTESESFINDLTYGGQSFAAPQVWYLLCPNGHKWTVKMLWRSVNHPDRVLLDRYVGQS